MFQAGAILDQTEFFKADKLVPEELFIESSLFEWVLDGVLGGMPISTSSDAMAYNKDMFAEAGLEEAAGGHERQVVEHGHVSRLRAEADRRRAVRLWRQLGRRQRGRARPPEPTLARARGDDDKKVAFINSPGIMQGA